MKRVAPQVLLTAGLAIGCGSQQSSEIEFSPRSGTQSYDSVEELRTDMTAGGFDCGPVVLDKTSVFSAQAGRCTLFGREVVLSIFGATTDRDAQIDATTTPMQQLGLEFGSLIGANWIVNCGNENNCVSLKAVLGGRINSGDVVKLTTAPATTSRAPVPEPPVVPTPYQEPAYAPPTVETTYPENPYPDSRGSNGAPTGQGGGPFAGCPSKLEQQPGTGIYEHADGSTYFDWAPQCL